MHEYSHTIVRVLYCTTIAIAHGPLIRCDDPCRGPKLKGSKFAPISVLNNDQAKARYSIMNHGTRLVVLQNQSGPHVRLCVTCCHAKTVLFRQSPEHTRYSQYLFPDPLHPLPKYSNVDPVIPRSTVTIIIITQYEEEGPS